MNINQPRLGSTPLHVVQSRNTEQPSESFEQPQISDINNLWEKNKDNNTHIEHLESKGVKDSRQHQGHTTQPLHNIDTPWTEKRATYQDHGVKAIHKINNPWAHQKEKNQDNGNIYEFGPRLSGEHFNTGDQKHNQANQANQQNQQNQQKMNKETKDAETETSYLDKLWQRRRETTKLFVFGLVVALGLSMHTLVEFYHTYFSNDYQLSFKQLQILRWVYPIGILCILINIRSFIL